MDKNKLNQALDSIRKEIPGCIVVGLTRFDDGINIANASNDPNFDVTTATAYGTNSIKTAMKVIQVINPKLHAEESLLTSEKMHFLIRMLPEKGVWLGIGLALTSNLGIARVVVKKYEDTIFRNL